MTQLSAPPRLVRFAFPLEKTSIDSTHEKRAGEAAQGCLQIAFESLVHIFGPEPNSDYGLT